MVSKTHNTAETMSLKACTLLIFMVALTGSVLAQRNKGSVQQTLDWASGIRVDGVLDDWGDTLLYEHAAQKLQYQIKNDNEHIYVAMRIVDMERQLQVLGQGCSFMINTAGKKREGPAVIYPVADRLAFRAIMSADNDNRPEDMREGALKAIRAIYIMRFEDVLDGQISLDNNYGIYASAAIDSSDALCFEAVIPFDRLGILADDAHELAFNVKINGVIIPTSGGAGNYMRRGYPYGYGSPYGYGQNMPARPREEPGVWVVAPLAKE